MNELIPHLSRFEALDEIVKRWENFTHGTLKSPAIRNELMTRQGSRCAVCGELINPAEEQVHHVSYVNLCYTSFNVKGIPPCSSCEVKGRCLDRLAAVHGCCHEVIHEKSSEEPQDTFEGDKSKVRFPRNRAPWTTNDEMQLNVLLASKKRMSSIAIALGRSPRAVRLHMDRIGIGEAKKKRTVSTATAQPAQISPAVRKSSGNEPSGVTPARHGKTWDIHEVNEITDGIMQGESVASLAQRLHRKESGVISKLYAISRTRADVQAKLLEAGWPELHQDYRQVLEKLRATAPADEQN
jgi:DNA-binding CsgD family transcriptional regulator